MYEIIEYKGKEFLVVGRMDEKIVILQSEYLEAYNALGLCDENCDGPLVVSKYNDKEYSIAYNETGEIVGYVGKIESFLGMKPVKI